MRSLPPSQAKKLMHDMYAPKLMHDLYAPKRMRGSYAWFVCPHAQGSQVFSWHIRLHMMVKATLRACRLTTCTRTSFHAQSVGLLVYVEYITFLSDDVQYV